MDYLLPVFQLLYFVVHFLFSLAQAVIDCFQELYHLIYNYLCWKQRFIPCYSQVLTDTSQWKKIPQHLGFIFTSKQANNYKHICHVINWSVGFGIHTLSLYDAEGILKLKLPSLLDNLIVSNEVSFRVLVDDQIYVRKNHGESSDYGHIKNSRKEWSNGLRKVTSINQFIPTLNKTSCQKRVITLNIFCIEDGKEDIVNCTKAACKIISAPIDTEFIKRSLITKDQLDPDLVLILGRPMCTLGFLPWQVRLTEFLNIPSVSRLDYNQFKKQLLLYSRCQQRCGS